MAELKYLPDDVEFVEELLPWQKRGLMYTRSGYGNKIPTSYMAKWNGRKYRVYCCIHSNCGTCYIVSKGETYIVHDYNLKPKKEKYDMNIAKNLSVVVIMIAAVVAPLFL